MLDRNVLRDLRKAQESGKIVTVKTDQGLFRGKVTHIGISSLILEFGRSRGTFKLQDIRNIWIREPLSINQHEYEGVPNQDLEEMETFEPVKVLKLGKPLSLQDLKKRLCDHLDTATLTIPGNEGGFTLRETFCLVCQTTVELEIKKAEE